MKGEETRVLVTGATGFVGSRLVQRLLDEGLTVHLIVRPQSGLQELKSAASRVTVLTHDGSTGHLVKLVAQAAPDCAFHLASLFVAEHRSEDVVSLLDANVRFGAQLLEAIALNGVRRLVSAGTSWQHFNSSSYRPSSLYAATKQAFDAILDYYVDACGLRAITLKLFDTYGPGDPRPKLFALLRSAARLQTILDLTPGGQLIDLVYIDDVVEAFFLAGERLLLDRSGPKEEYAVSSGRPLPLRQVVAIYAEASGATLNVRWGARPYRAREVMIPWSRGDVLPGWIPRVSIEEGIRRMEMWCSLAEGK
jgi:nucleoside-diphosphate-sugar epimerase